MPRDEMHEGPWFAEILENERRLVTDEGQLAWGLARNSFLASTNILKITREAMTVGQCLSCRLYSKASSQ